MDALTVLKTLDEKGIRATAEDGRLFLEPENRVTPDDIAAAKSVKADLLAELRSREKDALAYPPAQRARMDHPACRALAKTVADNMLEGRGPQAEVNLVLYSLRLRTVMLCPRDRTTKRAIPAFRKSSGKIGSM